MSRWLCCKWSELCSHVDCLRKRISEHSSKSSIDQLLDLRTFSFPVVEIATFGWLLLVLWGKGTPTAGQGRAPMALGGSVPPVDAEFYFVLKIVRLKQASYTGAAIIHSTSTSFDTSWGHGSSSRRTLRRHEGWMENLQDANTNGWNLHQWCSMVSNVSNLYAWQNEKRSYGFLKIRYAVTQPETLRCGYPRCQVLTSLRYSMTLLWSQSQITEWCSTTGSLHSTDATGRLPTYIGHTILTYIQTEKPISDAYLCKRRQVRRHSSCIWIQDNVDSMRQCEIVEVLWP